MWNFAAITKAMMAEGGLIQLHETLEPAAELAQVIQELLSDDERRVQIGEHARIVCESNRGATTRTLSLLATILDASASPAREASFSTVPAATAK